jgi:sterol 14-demethylase
MSLPSDSADLLLYATACSIALSTLYYIATRHPRSNVPNAPLAIPLLGHALIFRKNPNDFFRKAQSVVGPVFRINLAGRRMIMVTSPAVMEKVTAAPETILSSETAVREIGFDYTLGLFNVTEGTSFHRKVLKSDAHAAFLKRVMSQLQHSFDTELSKTRANKGRVEISDLFVFSRRCFVRACLVAFIGKNLESDALISDIMIFMDRVEDATAKAAVLPRYLAIPLVLRPVQAQRLQLQKRIAALLEPMLQSASAEGPWLNQFRHLPQQDGAAVAAELVIGLVFAAHKNPSIAAAQSLIYVLQYSENNLDLQKEAKLVARGELPDRTPHLYANVRETLRLTSLSIGSIRTVMCDRFDATSEDGTIYTFLKGESVCVAHNVMDTDPSRWSDASSFVPNRFLEKHPQYLVFSRGIHKCPGERIAMTMVQILLALFLDRNARLEGPVPGLDFERATVAQRAGPVRISLDYRGSSF